MPTTKKKKTTKAASKTKDEAKKEKKEKKPVAKKKAAVRAKVVRTEKKSVIESFRTHTGDTGSPQVQVAILSDRINSLTDHLKDHPKDNHSRRGLIMMVGKRRKLLNYLQSKDKEAYTALLEKLDIGK